MIKEVVLWTLVQVDQWIFVVVESRKILRLCESMSTESSGPNEGVGEKVKWWLYAHYYELKDNDKGVEKCTVAEIRTTRRANARV